MPKKSKPAKTENTSKNFSTAYPWKCRHLGDQSEIVVYDAARKDWEIVATVNRTTVAGAETMANFICNLVNGHQKNEDLLLSAVEALELCLEDRGLTFSSEQAAEHAVSDIKRVI